ncbi:hypothetical protein ACF0H5_007669 [Mactra antiquata]
MSLDALKERLNKLKKRSEDTYTFDITDSQKWIKVNSPEEWLEYIQHVKNSVPFPNEHTQFRFLSQLYDKAFQDIDSSLYKNKISFAKLFIDHGLMLSKFVPEDAGMIYQQARLVCRRFSIVHVASAQFEVERGNTSKAKKILEKAFLLEASPKEDIDEALKKLDQGDNHLMKYSPTTSKSPHLDSRTHKVSTSSDSPDSVLIDNVSTSLSTSISISKPEKSHTFQSQNETCPKVLPSSVRKHTLNKFRSTPLLSSERRRNVDILPRRVRKIDLPAFETGLNEEEEMNTMDSFKPLDTSKVSFSTHAHTSGYLSMTADSTIPMETKPPEIPDTPLKEETPVKPVLQPVPNNIPAPILETPNNKAPPVQPASTPMPHMDVITVNDVQYAVLGLMGKGGSSKVYQVFDGKVKAIKCVDLDNANDIIVEGYKNEIKLLKRLQYCDKVIKMYDSEYKHNENKLYVVMEAGNDDLATFFRSQTKNRKPLSENLITFYWEVMLEAVQALHKEGIIHSDLKPANFLFVGGNLKLIDFGIAKALQQDKTSVVLETQIGTLNYMSPEAIMDSCGGDNKGNKPQFKISVKSDVWSLGCILYNMVYGRTPFQSFRNDFFKLQAIMNPDYQIEFPAIPNTHLIDVMQRCLNRDPKSRPSIDELLSHPYLKAGKEESETSIPPVKENLNDKRMEALINTLSEQYALSPSGIRNLVQKTMDTSQKTPESHADKPRNNAQIKQNVPLMKPPPAVQGLVQANKSKPSVKHVRTPLSSLNLDGLHGKGNDPMELQ